MNGETIGPRELVGTAVILAGLAWRAGAKLYADDAVRDILAREGCRPLN